MPSYHCHGAIPPSPLPYGVYDVGRDAGRPRRKLLSIRNSRPSLDEWKKKNKAKRVSKARQDELRKQWDADRAKKG